MIVRWLKSHVLLDVYKRFNSLLTNLQVKRKNIDSHLNKNPTTHFIVLFQKNLQLENEIMKLKNNIDDIYCMNLLDDSTLIMTQQMNELNILPISIVWKINEKFLVEFEKLKSPQFQLSSGKL
jgi:hypothetical protein